MDLDGFTVERCVSDCKFKPLNISGVSLVLAAISELLTVDRDGDKVALGIVVLLVEVKFGVACNVGVDRKLSFEYFVVSVVLVLDQDALGCHQVGSG